MLEKEAKQKMYHRGHRSLVFTGGDKVTVKDYRKVNKPKWIKGIIFKRIGKSTYLIKILELNDVIWKRHLKEIKIFV